MHTARHSSVAWERVGAILALEHPSLSKAAQRLIPSYATALDYRGWPISTISEDTSLQARRRALESGRYGRCVYHCDNDVVDHQVVNMELENGTSVILVMHGHSHREGRTMRYDGTRATLIGRYYVTEQVIEIHDHLTGELEVIRLVPGAVGAAGHGGGDVGLMAGFVRAVRDPAQALTTARQSLESHLLAFAAEEARVRGTIVHMNEYRRRAEKTGRA